MQISIAILVANANQGISYVKRLVRNFKARVLSYPNSIFEAEPCLVATLTELNDIELLRQTSLVITPNAYTEGILYDVIPNTTLGDMNVVRATTATRVNSAGLIEVVPRNLSEYSEIFSNSYWLKTGTTITDNATAAPNGTTTADKLVENSANSTHRILINAGISVIQSSQYTISVYAKKAERDVIQIVNNQLAGAYFNLTNGAITNVSAGITASVETLSNGWYRCIISFSAVTTIERILIYLTDGTNTTYTGNGTSGVYIWGAQLEDFATATEYFPTTTRLNIPRIDYTNGSCPSLLVEPQRTNVLLQSNDLSQSVWSKTNYTLSSTTSIQGVNATRVTKNATNNGFYLGTGARNLINTVGTFATGVKTLSFYIRKGNTNKAGFLINNVLVGVLTSVSCEFDFITKTFTNVSLGLTASFENYNTDVYKIILTINDTGVLTTKAVWIAPIDSSNNTVDGGYLDFGFAQWELGSFATSYIPTVASTVTRNADIISKTGISSLIGQTEGTVFIEADNKILGQTNRTLFYVSDATANNFITVNYSAAQANTIRFFVIANGGVGALSFIINTAPVVKIAVTYKNGVNKIYINGSLIYTQTGVAFTSNLESVYLGIRNNLSEQLGERIESLQLYKTELTSTECIALTTL